MTRILCLWFPNWPIQRWFHARPELKQVTVALYTSNPRRGDRVVTCCGRAYRMGIRPEMSLAEAKAIAGQQQLAVEQHNPTADRMVLQALAEQCEPFSPRVAIEEDNNPESLLLDITGLEHLFGSEENLVAQVTGLFSPRQSRGLGPDFHFRIAVANTVGAAWAVAHFAHTLEPPPSFPVIIPAGEDHLLLPLPIGALRISPEVLEALTQLGIKSLEQVLELPRNSLLSRFGDELLRRVDQLTGGMQELVETHRPPPQFSTDWPLEHATADRVVVTHVTTKLIDRLVRELFSHGRGAIQLAVVLWCEQQGPLHLRVGLFRPSADAEHLKELVEMHLENLQVPEPISRIELSAMVTAQLSLRQHELFAEDQSAQSCELALLVDRLSSRLGLEAVVGPQRCASALPERACHYVPLAGQVRGRRGGTYSAPPESRPLLLHQSPRPIELVSVVPDGPPQCVWLNRQRQNISQHWGPERIETGWWRGPPVRRDYYRIETETGSRLWVFRCLRKGKWFLHGEFS